MDGNGKFTVCNGNSMEDFAEYGNSMEDFVEYSVPFHIIP